MTQYQRILAVAIPIMISNAMLPLVGLVDAAVIGQIGEVAPLGAVATGGSVMATVFWLFNFLAITTTAVIGRAIGEHDADAMNVHLRRSLILAIAIGVSLIALIPLWRVVVPLGFGASPAVRPELNTYISIRFFGAPAIMLMHVVTGYLLAYERTKTILLIELLIQFVNITLDLVFVIGLGFGVAGVAVASIVAEISGVAVALWIVRVPFLNAMRAAARSPHVQGIHRFFANNGYLFVRALALNFTILYFLRVSTGMSDEILALNGIFWLFISFTAQTTDGFAQAVEVFTAQSIGRRSIRELRQYAAKSGVISLSLALILVAVVALWGDVIFGWVAKNDALRALAPEYFVWLYWAFLIGVVAWSFDGIFFGSGLAREMAVSTLVTFVVFVAVTPLLVEIWGNHGLWFAFVSSYFGRAILLAAYYPRVERLITAPPMPA